jgi:hypothetical protein
MVICSQMALQVRPADHHISLSFLKEIITGIDKSDLNLFNDGYLELASVLKISTISTYIRYIISNI